MYVVASTWDESRSASAHILFAMACSMAARWSPRRTSFSSSRPAWSSCGCGVGGVITGLASRMFAHVSPAGFWRISTTRDGSAPTTEPSCSTMRRSTSRRILRGGTFGSYLSPWTQAASWSSIASSTVSLGVARPSGPGKARSDLTRSVCDARLPTDHRWTVPLAQDALLPTMRGLGKEVSSCPPKPKTPTACGLLSTWSMSTGARAEFACALAPCANAGCPWA
mmetsp:Transcript_10267/g.30347  ORF Transcript_10267/g.30347 Transcript_10267/m.30347 type:complete len:224 (+) Transcript_10267:2355-3026(+)